MTALEPGVAIAWLEEAARYFEKRDTRGEDAAHWSNVQNAENARKAAACIRTLLDEGFAMSAEIEHLRGVQP